MDQKNEEKITVPSVAKRERSPNYPGVSLARAVKSLSEIRDEMSFKSFSRQSIASAFDVAPNSGAFSTKIAALFHFGLIEGSSSSMSITDLGRRVLNPISDVALKQALQEAFVKPELYGKLLADFGGNVLPKSLANILFHDYGLTESAKDVCARCFQESAAFAGLLSEEGTLLHPGDQEIQRTAAPRDQEFQSSLGAPPEASVSGTIGTPAKFIPGYYVYQVPALSGKVMLLQLPGDIDREDLISIQDQLEMIGKWIDRRNHGHRAVPIDHDDTPQ